MLNIKTFMELRIYTCARKLREEDISSAMKEFAVFSIEKEISSERRENFTIGPG